MKQEIKFGQRRSALSSSPKRKNYWSPFLNPKGQPLLRVTPWVPPSSPPPGSTAAAGGGARQGTNWKSAAVPWGADPPLRYYALPPWWR